MSALVLLWVGALLAAPTLHVESSSAAPAFEQALRAERPGLELVPAGAAELWARLDESREALELRVTDPESNTVRLARRIPVRGEREAALRVAVLLTLSTLDRELSAARSSTVAAARLPSEPEAVTLGRPRSPLSFHVVLGSAFWLDQAAPMLSFGAAFLGRWSWLRAGAQVNVYGLGCCARANDAIEADWTELALGGLVGAELWETEELRLAVDLGVAMLGTFGSAAPADGVFAGPGLARPIQALGLELMAAVELEMALTERLALVARSGLRVLPRRLAFELPEPFQSAGPALTSAWGAPFLHLGVRFAFR